MENIGLEAKLKEQKKQLIDSLFENEILDEGPQITNMNILTLDEWKSFSKERRESIIMFVTMACEPNKNIDVEMFDKETAAFMARQGLRKLILSM